MMVRFVSNPMTNMYTESQYLGVKHWQWSLKWQSKNRFQLNFVFYWLNRDERIQ